jgi:hypothetical protein
MPSVGSILLAATEGGRWRPGIGDPTVLGWVTVAAYLLTALGCGLAAWREPMLDGRRRTRGRPSRFWLILAGLMLALGINKQLDLQSLVTQIGRDVVRAMGLYSERRELQLGFIVAVALVCVGALAGFLWAARRTLERRWPAIAGILFILGFVVIRAASFHHIDGFLGARLVGLKWNWIFELSGIAVVAAAAVQILLTPPPRPPDRSALAMIYHYKVNSR